jgi:hypothetical protein
MEEEAAEQQIREEMMEDLETREELMEPLEELMEPLSSPGPAELMHASRQARLLTAQKRLSQAKELQRDAAVRLETARSPVLLPPPPRVPPMSQDAWEREGN